MASNNFSYNCEPEFYIYVEDYHGIPFWKKLLERLKDNEIIPKRKTKVASMLRICNQKDIKIIKANILSGENRYCILIYDGDNFPQERKRVMEEKIGKYPGLSNKTKILVFETEIEELILFTRNMRDPKPSKYLKNHEKYEKKRLVRYAEQLNLEKLIEHKLISELISVLKEVTC